LVRTCSVNGCDKLHNTRGFCNAHYARWRRYGDPLYIPNPDESRRKNSESHKGKSLSTEHVEKIRSALKKRKPHPNSIEALRKSNKDRIGTKRPETGKKVSDSLKKKWTDHEYKKKMKIVRKKQFSNPETISKISKSLKKIWTDHEYKKRQSKSHKGIIAGMLGKKHSAKTRIKLSESHKGQIPWSAGKPLPEKTKKKIGLKKKKWFEDHPEEKEKQSFRIQKWLNEHPEFREQASKRRAKQKFPFKDSKSVEIKIQEILKGFDIPFKKHHNIKLENSNHQADILVEPNLIIEGFGDYWHFNPKKYDSESIQKRRQKTIKVKEVWNYDKYVIDGMKKQGYKVLVVWESDLKNDLENSAGRILKFLKNNDKNL